ncbi:PEBP-like protein [Trametopsis cervina]|nr:PEBP-like protein [Trametopsis cervina]
MAFKNILACALLSLASLVVAQDRSTAQVKAAFDNANIPANAEITFNPSVVLEVTFPQASARPVAVHAGIHLPRNQTVGPPQFAVLGDIERTQRFVVATVDLDAPTPQAPTAAQIRHFLGSDFVRGANEELLKELVNTTAPVSGWLQPTPPAGSDAHRYVFLLFHQPAGFDQQTLVTPSTSISNFNISSFAEATHLGNPIGGTFILVAPDATA